MCMSRSRTIFCATAALSGAYGLLLTTMAHAVGWPVAEGGSARIVDALVDEIESLGGQVMTAGEVADLLHLPVSTVYYLARRGEIPACRLGRTWRFVRPRIEELLGS